MKYKMDVKEVMAGVFEVTSETKPGMSYLVDKREGKIRCTCKDHIIRGTPECKHIKQVDLSVFGKIVNPQPASL